jgi:hypothetical protein
MRLDILAGIVAIISGLLWAANFWGNLQVLKSWFDNRGTMMNAIRFVIFSQTFQLSVFVVGILTLVCLKLGVFDWLLRLRRPNFTLTVSDVVLSEPISTPAWTRLQITVTIRNDGTPSTIHNWELKVLLPKETISADHLLGQEPVSDFIEGKRLDELLGRSQLGHKQEDWGFVFFGVKRIGLKDVVEQLILVLSVEDEYGKQWRTQVNVKDLIAKGRRDWTTPPKDH